MTLAVEAPSSAIGPSGPTEPPPPIVRADDVVIAKAGIGAIVPFPCLVDQMIPATPWPVGVWPSRDMSGPTMRPERTGATRTNHATSAASEPTEGPMETV